MRILNRFLTLILLPLFMMSCAKYEEGPSFSLRGKKARVANTWVVDYAEDIGDNVEITSDYSGETFTFEKNGDYLENGSDKGTWDFNAEKEFIIVTENDGSTDEYKILMLKENEMRLEILNEELIYLIPG